MGLSEKEQRMLEQLLQKKDAPDAPPVGKSIHVTIDAGDKEQVAWATRQGFLEPEDLEEEAPEESPNGDAEPDAKPRRAKSYFSD